MMNMWNIMNNVILKSFALTAGTLLLLTQQPRSLSAGDRTPETHQAPQIKVIDGSMTQRTVTLDKVDGIVEVEFHTLQLRIKFPEGRQGDEAILVLREPTTGYYWWDLQSLDFQSFYKNKDAIPTLLEQFRFFIVNETIVAFRLENSRLSIQICGDRQPNFEGTLQRIIEISIQNQSHIYSDPILSRQTVALIPVLGREFFSGTKLVAHWRPSKLTNVTMVDDLWLLQLEGPDGEKATVTLSVDFEVQKATRGGKTVFPDDDQKD